MHAFKNHLNNPSFLKVQPTDQQYFVRIGQEILSPVINKSKTHLSNKLGTLNSKDTGTDDCQNKDSKEAPFSKSQSKLQGERQDPSELIEPQEKDEGAVQASETDL